jgi:cytoskeletal protein CcmA (bactofilin family)
MVISKLKGLGAEGLNGFLDHTTELVGELRFKEVFRVDGRLRGRVFSENALIIGESAIVEADIDCAVVSISGTVKGHVQGRQRLELLAGARVEGTLVSPRLVIEEGAFFQGQCDMKSAAAPRGAVVPIAPPGRSASGSEPV